MRFRLVLLANRAKTLKRAVEQEVSTQNGVTWSNGVGGVKKFAYSRREEG